ncbi:MAG: NTP transferase domain-containing protein [Acidobacteriota bacterium]
MHATVTPLRIAAVVLAAGRSSRMGTDKLRLSWRGRMLLEWVLDAACALSPVVLVGGPPGLVHRSPGLIRLPAPLEAAQAGPAPVLAPDTQLQRADVKEVLPGQADSLKAGIRALPPGLDGAMVLLGDMPQVTPELVAKLALAFNPGHFLVPRCGGRRGNPVIIPAQWFDKVLELEGDTGARPLLIRPDAPVDYLDVDDPAVLADVDTPEDYSRLRNQP